MNTSFNNELQQLQMELRAQNFDIIRFSTYRTACKLRFIQKKLNFHLLDLLNVIESLRECLTWPTSELSSNSLTPSNRRTPTPIQSTLASNDQYLSISRLTTILTSIYTNLNKRLPASQQILHIDHCVQSAIAWFLYVYNTNESSNNFSIRFNSFRVVLVLLCTGKLVDKMRHLFTSYLSSSSSLNSLTHNQIDELLHEILALPYALQEISHQTYRSNNAQLIFSHISSTSVHLNEFLDTLIYNDTTPNCLQWLIIFHRLISVENVIHRVKCSACQRPSFSGFRYKCQQCHDRTYQLCQDCFWRGRVSDQHLPTHEMKEYTFFTSPVKELRQSIRRSFQCMPKNEDRRTHMVPSSSSSPRFFSWKNRNNSTKRHQSSIPTPIQPVASISSPSSPLMMEKEQQISSSSSPQLVRLTTPKPIHVEEQRTITKVKTDNRKIDENSNQTDFDEHIQIALYAQQLASICEKHKQNPQGIPPPNRYPSCPMNLQMNPQYYSRMMNNNTPSTMIPMSSIRSMHIDHQSAEKRLIISKLEAKNRRILREINTLRAQLKRRNSLDYANASLNNELHAYSDTDACHTGLYPSSPGLSSSMNRLEQRYTQTLPHQRSSSRHDLSSYPQYQINQTPRTRPHQMRRAGSTETNPYLEQELQTLISRKHHLESRIDHLQQSKEELTTQLDTLGKILRYSPQTHQRSATASPHGRLSVSPSRMVYQTGHTNTTNSRKINQNMSFRSYSTPPTPVHDPLTPTETNINEPISISQHTKSLRTDLLIAADSLTSAMSSLVQQLNTESTESLVTAVEPIRNGQTSGTASLKIHETKINSPDSAFPKASMNGNSTKTNDDVIGHDSGSRTDEESLLTSDDDEDEDDDDRREERTTDDDLLRTTDDDDGGGAVAPTKTNFSVSPTKRKAPLANE